MKQNTLKISKIVYPLVALALLIAVIATSTFSWLKVNYVTNLATNDYFTISADAGLEMNYGDDDNNQGSINIQNIKLSECSSVDGRNFYFPLSNYSSKGDNDFVDGVSTNDLVYRDGTANDKNRKYISVDFTLSSQSATSVWLSNESRITCTDQSHTTANAIRVAFVENKPGGNTTIFDNSAMSEDIVKNNAVEKVSDSGEIVSTKLCDVRSFNEFVFGNEYDNTLFEIAAGETLKVTLNIWLEGTDVDCNESVLDLSDLQIFIKFSTSYEELRTIYFIDNTLEKWVDDDVDDGKCYVYAVDEHGIHHRMTQSDNYSTDYTWFLNVPGSTESIRFVRYNPDTYVPNREYNSWEAGTLGTCSTYVAFGHSAGMWSENFKGESITVFDGTTNGWLRGSDECEFHVKFSVTDGNGTVQNMNYKMSYQYEVNRYSIIIPSNVTTLSFDRMNNSQTTVHNSWNNLQRGSNKFFNILDNTTGYWSNRYIYINDAAGLKGNAEFGAYFYNNSTNKHQWTGMHSKSPSGYYVAVVPSGIDQGVVYTRYTSVSSWTNPEPAWTSMHNQTLNTLESFGSNNMFMTTGWTGDNNKYMNGSWSHTSE